MYASFSDFQRDFYLNFIKDDRWRYLTSGLANTLKITFFAVLLGIVIGIVVATVRSSYDKVHDEMRPGPGKFLLSLLE